MIRQLPERMNWKDIPHILQYRHGDLQGSFSTGLLLHLLHKELILSIAWLNNQGIKSQKCISISFDISVLENEL